jgi:hypothetical protein
MSDFVQLARLVAAQAAEPLMTPQEKERLTSLQAEWDLCHQRECSSTAGTALAAFDTQRGEHASIVRKGDTPPAPKTKEQFEGEYREAAEAAKAAKQGVCSEAAGIALVIVERFCALAKTTADNIESQEVSAHFAYQLPHRPSVLLEELRKLPSMARARIPRYSRAETQPKNMLPFLTY